MRQLRHSTTRRAQECLELTQLPSYRDMVRLLLGARLLLEASGACMGPCGALVQRYTKNGFSLSFTLVMKRLA